MEHLAHSQRDGRRLRLEIYSCHSIREKLILQYLLRDRTFMFHVVLWNHGSTLPQFPSFCILLTSILGRPSVKLVRDPGERCVDYKLFAGNLLCRSTNAVHFTHKNVGQEETHAFNNVIPLFVFRWHPNVRFFYQTRFSYAQMQYVQSKST